MLHLNALKPTAVLFDAVFKQSVNVPNAVLLVPTVLVRSEFTPTAVLQPPVVL